MRSRDSRKTVAALVAAIVTVGVSSAKSWAGQAGAQDDLASVPRTSVIEFTALQTAGAVLVVDVRSAEFYKAGHIPGAINVPFIEVGERARELSRAAGTRRIVTYCACAAEHTSALAVIELARQGVTSASALAGGYNEWVLKGGRVEK